MWKRQPFVDSIPVELPILDGLYDKILMDCDLNAFESLRAYEKLQAIEKYAINSLVRNGERSIIWMTEYPSTDATEASNDMVSEGGPVMRADEYLYHDEAC